MDGQPLGEVGHGGLGAGVGRDLGQGQIGVHAGNVQDVAALTAHHLAGESLGRQQGADEVQVEHHLHAALVKVEEGHGVGVKVAHLEVFLVGVGAGVVAAGTIYEDVAGAEVCQHVFGHLQAVGLVHDVAGIAAGYAALGLDRVSQLLELFHVAAQQGDLCTGPRQRFGEDGAQGAAGTGDNGHLAGEVGVQNVLFHNRSPLRCLNFARAPVQDLIEPGEEGSGGDGGGDDVADRLGQEDAEHRVCDHMRQDEDEGDEQNQLAQAGQQQADLGLTQRHKALLAGDLDAQREDASHVDAHGPGGVFDQSGIRGEDAGHHTGHQHHQHPEDGCVAEADQKLEAEGLLDALFLACTEVEAHHRLAALADAGDRHTGQLGNAGDDRHCAHGHVAAVAGQAGAEADREQALGGHHDEGGDAQRQDGQHDLPFGLEVLFLQPEGGLGAGEEADDPDGTHSLAEHGGDGCTPHPQTKEEDEDGVEHDVDDRTDDGGQHTDLGKALCGDEGVHAQHDEDADRAEDVDAAVRQRIGQGGVAGTEHPQQGRCGGVEHDGQQHREDQQHGEAVADDLFRLVFVALAHGDGGAGRTTGTDEHRKGVQQHQDGGEQAHAGQRGCADAGDVADVDTVHDVIQQVDDLGHHGRDHQLEQQLFDAAGAHISLFFLCLCHWFLLA